MPDSQSLLHQNSAPTFWACCCCDGEWPTAGIASDEDGCGDDGWIVRFENTDDGRRRLAHYRETYRSDLLK